MPPAVSPNPQMGGTARIQRPPLRHRRLRNPQPLERSLDHHLAGQFHPRRLQSQLAYAGGAEPPQPTMKIAHRRAGKPLADARQQRRAHIAVQQRHNAGRHLPGKAVAHHQVAAPLQLLPERFQRIQVVFPVPVAQDDELPPGRGDAGPDCVPVAGPRFGRHPRAGRRRPNRRTVGTAVVHHQNLAGDGVALQKLPRLADAVGYGTLLIATENQDGQRAIGHIPHLPPVARIVALRPAAPPAASPPGRRAGHNAGQSAAPGTTAALRSGPAPNTPKGFSECAPS